jgi:hypothetical protein
MKMSENIKELAAALSKFQGEVTNPKNSAKNPQFNSKYAPLQDILALARPLLAKQGLSLIQGTTGDLENVTISTMLIHESGQYIETEPFILKGEQTLKGGGKVLNVQGAGSMITYIRRYQVSAILGLSSEDDDDGSRGSKPTKGQQETPPETIDSNKINSIKTLAEKKGINQASICAAYSLTKFEEMSFNMWKDATDKLNLRPDKKAPVVEKPNVLEGVI